MAHYQVFDRDDRTTGFSYNTDFSVGPSGVDRSDDVMLVQRMLRYLYIDQPAYMVERMESPLPKGIEDLQIDGEWSDALGEAIIAFKRRARLSGIMLHPDPIVLPCGPDARVKSRVTRATFTIRVMHRTCEVAADDANANPYVVPPDEWPYDVGLPQRLRDALRVYRDQALGWHPNT